MRAVVSESESDEHLELREQPRRPLRSFDRTAGGILTRRATVSASEAAS